MKCKNCGNDVIPKMSTWQIVFTIIFCLFFVIPGILYAVICRKVTCPVCKNNVYVKYTSPNNKNNKDINDKKK